jgi:hypothetical protein
MLPLRQRSWASDLFIYLYFFLEGLSCYTMTQLLRLCTLYPLCMMVKVGVAVEPLNVAFQGVATGLLTCAFGGLV